MDHPDFNGNGNGEEEEKCHPQRQTTPRGVSEYGSYLLFGGIIIGLISGLQGPEVTRADDSFFVSSSRGCSAFSCSKWA